MKNYQALYNPPENSDNLAKAKKKVVLLQAKSSRL